MTGSRKASAEQRYVLRQKNLKLIMWGNEEEKIYIYIIQEVSDKISLYINDQLTH